MDIPVDPRQPQQQAAMRALVDWLLASDTRENIRGYLRVFRYTMLQVREFAERGGVHEPESIEVCDFFANYHGLLPGDMEYVADLNRRMPRSILLQLDESYLDPTWQIVQAPWHIGRSYADEFPN